MDSTPPSSPSRGARTAGRRPPASDVLELDILGLGTDPPWEGALRGETWPADILGLAAPITATTSTVDVFSGSPYNDHIIAAAAAVNNNCNYSNNAAS